MTSATKAPGIPASFEPVDWNPPGLPTDPDEIMEWLVDPARAAASSTRCTTSCAGSRPSTRTVPRSSTARGRSPASPRPTCVFRNPRAVNDPQVVDEAFSNGDGAFTRVMRNVMVWQHPEPHQRVRNLVKAAFTPQAIARWRPIAERREQRAVRPHRGRRRRRARRAVQLRAPVQRDRPHPRHPRGGFPAHQGTGVGLRPRRREDGRRRRRAPRRRRGARVRGLLRRARRAAAAAPGDDLLSSLLEAEADGERLHAHRARRQLHPVAAGRPRDDAGPARQRPGGAVP